MHILGINAYHGDSSACLVSDGHLVAAIEEERIRRVKHWAGFPSQSVQFCLDYAGLTLAEVDHIAVGRNPRAQLGNKIVHTLKNRPSPRFVFDRIKNSSQILDLKDALAANLEVDKKAITAKLHNIEHHRAHMASSFLLSPFERAACLSIDGFGDFASTMFGSGQGSEIQVHDRILFPHSLGIFYLACCQYLGFDKYGDEYKVMGLAAYGEPEYLADFRTIVKTSEDGRFEMDLDFFRHHREGIDMEWQGGSPSIDRVYSDKWIERWGPARQPGDPLDARHKNLASSLQAMCEDVYFNALNRLARVESSRNLCLAGGVAFNSVANGLVFDRTPFEELHIHPAAGDAGTAVGAAMVVWHEILGNPRESQFDNVYLGPEHPDREIASALKTANLDYQWFDSSEQLVQNTVDRIEAGDVVGWFQGRSEWGPRALGNRSIVCDPRRPDMKDILNARIKKREPFRPFAPAILEDRSGQYFEESYPVPFMQQVYRIRTERRAEIPAVTHEDGTGRLQTVSRQANPLFYRLIEAFDERTGTPILVNTSLNENEPIVNSVEQAIDVFKRSRMDTLVIGKGFVRKHDVSSVD